MRLKAKEKIQTCLECPSDLKLFSEPELERIGKQAGEDIRKILNALYGKMVMDNQ